jgi:hypothetical protein
MESLSKFGLHLKQIFRISKHSEVSTASTTETPTKEECFEGDVSTPTVETSSKHYETLSKDYETLSKLPETYVVREQCAQVTPDLVHTFKADGRSKERSAKQVASYQSNFAQRKEKRKHIERSSPAVYDAIFDE